MTAEANDYDSTKRSRDVRLEIADLFTKFVEITIITLPGSLCKESTAEIGICLRAVISASMELQLGPRGVVN